MSGPRLPAPRPAPPSDPPDKVYAIGYRALDQRPNRPRVLWPLARTLLTLAWRRWSTKIALVVCVVVFGVHGVWLVGQLLTERYLSTAAHHGVPGIGLGATGLGPIVGTVRETIASFIRTQFFAGALAVAAFGGRAVAEDLRTGALDLYLSRPLSPSGYVAGKALGVALVPFATIAVPALLLWVTALGIAPPELRAGLWWLGGPTALVGTLAVAAHTALVLGVSALGMRGPAAEVVFIAVLLVTSSLGEALTLGGLTAGGYLSPERDLRTLAEALFEVGSPSVGGSLLDVRTLRLNPSAGGSLVALLGYITIGFSVVWLRVRREASR